MNVVGSRKWDYVSYDVHMHVSSTKFLKPVYSENGANKIWVLSYKEKGLCFTHSILYACEYYHTAKMQTQ